MNFQVGDVVKLKSGGPAMTVKEVSDRGIICNWFDQDGKVQRQGFASGQLVTTDEAGSGVAPDPPSDILKG